LKRAENTGKYNNSPSLLECFKLNLMVETKSVTLPDLMYIQEIFRSIVSKMVKGKGQELGFLQKISCWE
jgi:hypothetical protein